MGISKQHLSGSVDGQPIKVSSVSGDAIHTAINSTTQIDEVWLWASNIGDRSVNMTLNVGTGKAVFPIAAKDTINILPGTILNNSKAISAALDISATSQNSDANGQVDYAQFRNTSVQLSISSPGVVTWPNHGLQVGRSIQFVTTGALPTGLAINTTYYIISAGFTKDTFQLATADGGTAINFTGFQNGLHECRALMTVTIATPGVMTVHNHKFMSGQGFLLFTTGALPTGLNTTSPFYVISTSYAQNAFQFSSTPGGSAQATSGSQSGVHMIKPVLTIEIGADANIYYPVHGLVADQRIRFTTTGALPTGITAGADYYVCRQGLTLSSFKICSTVGGSPITTSGSQSGIHSAILPAEVSVYGFVNRIAP